MILKLTGSLLVIISSFLIGYSKTLKLKQEVQIINIFILFFSYAKVDITNTRKTIEDIISNFCKNANSRYYEIIMYYFSNSNKKEEEVQNIFQIDADIHRKVLSCFDAITYSAIVEIEKILDEGIRQLQEDYKKIKERYMKNSRLFTLLGIFCGVSICIILL